MAKAFDYMQVPLAIVATGLIGATIEAEGAYFRVARAIAVNGPMTLDAIRDVVGGQINRVERMLDYRSTDVEPLLSFSWLEEWRQRAEAARTRLSKAGHASAEKRAKKKGKKNTSSTHVEPQLNDGSTTVEQSTILYSTIVLEENSEKERARKFETDCAAVWASNPGRLVEGERRAFVAYWTEPSASGKMRFEGEKYFDHGRRMDTWMANYTKSQNRRLPPSNPMVRPELNATRRDLKTTWD